MRRLGSALAVLGATLLLPATGAAAAGPSLTPSDGDRFPERSFVVTLPEHIGIGAGRLSVSENGAPVRRLRVEPAGAAQRAKLGVVLAIDTSASMRGGPIDAAVAASRAFARQRDARQPLGLLTFSGRSRIALPLTTDPYDIRGALSREPRARGGTHIYDAALQAVELLRRSSARGGFIVVLSDGTDRGSQAAPAEVVAAARRANVRIFTVGLRSKHFDAGALHRLASAAGGRYSEASSARELQPIYTALGSELSNAHLLRYRSLAGPRRRVAVAVRVRGLGTATASYTSPRLDPQAGSARREHSAWTSPFAVVLAAMVVAGLLGLALVVLLSRGRPSPRDRVSQFVGRQQPEERDGATLTGRLVAQTERSLSGTGWWGAFAQELDVSDIRWPAAKVVAASATGTLALAALLTATSGQPLPGLVLLGLAPVGVRALVRARAARQRRRFGDQLADHLAVVGSAMRVGHSFPAALASVLEDAPEPVRSEFARAVADERLGSPLEDALEAIGERMDSRDMEQVALLARLQREAGADAAEMLDRVVDTIRERQLLRRTVRTLTAQGRLARWILSILPVVVLVGLTVTNPRFVDPLYNTGTGKVLLMIATAMVVAGSLVIKRLVEFEI